MPVRQYLDHTVVPTILQALTELAKERPDKPIQFVADYLAKHAESEGTKNNKSKDDEWIKYVNLISNMHVRIPHPIICISSIVFLILIGLVKSI